MSAALSLMPAGGPCRAPCQPLSMAYGRPDHVHGRPAADFNYSVYHERRAGRQGAICGEHTTLLVKVSRYVREAAARDREGLGKGGKANRLDGLRHPRASGLPATGVHARHHPGGLRTGPRITSLVDSLQFYFLLVFNKDGYEFTWTTERLHAALAPRRRLCRRADLLPRMRARRMWRKTRTPNANTTCIGTDPNRNWPYHWGEAGTSTNPCTETFEGPTANSEPCVQAVIAYLSNQPNLKGYIDFHSYSQLWMTPWGYTETYPKDYAQQNNLRVHGGAGPFSTLSTARSRRPLPGVGSSADRVVRMRAQLRGEAAARRALMRWPARDVVRTTGVVYSAAVELRDTGARFSATRPIVPRARRRRALLVFAEAIVQVRAADRR